MVVFPHIMKELYKIDENKSVDVKLEVKRTRDNLFECHIA